MYAGKRGRRVTHLRSRLHGQYMWSGLTGAGNGSWWNDEWLDEQLDELWQYALVPNDTIKRCLETANARRKTKRKRLRRSA